MEVLYIILIVIAGVLFIFGNIFGRLQKKYKSLGDTNYFKTGMFDLTSNFKIDNDKDMEYSNPVIIKSTLVEETLESFDDCKNETV